MTEQLFPTEQIRPNPWQTRQAEDPAHVAELAADIAERGLLQIPVGRCVNGHVELAFGHTRLAAWKTLHNPGPFPVQVRELTDKQMAEYAITENSKRRDLSPIEKAQAMQQYIADFGVSQAEAGKLFGLNSQGAVSNLLRLLKLPDDARTLVHQGAVPERVARQLVPLAQIAPKQTVEIAAAIAKADNADKESVADEQMRVALNKVCVRLSNEMWPLDWKTKDKPTCRDCPLHFALKYVNHCGDRACFDVKTELWTQHELKRLSDKFGIPVAEQDEKVYPLKLDYHVRSKIETWLKSKAKRPDTLRFIVNNGDDSFYTSYHRDILNSRVVLLASTDKNVLELKADEIASVKALTETEAERNKRNAAEERERAQRREERSAERRERADVNWLIESVAGALGPQLTISGGVLRDVYDTYHRINYVGMTDWPEISTAWKAMDKAASGKDDAPEREAARRRGIILICLSHKIGSYTAPKERFNWNRACMSAVGIAERFSLELPDGWDRPPIHKTSSSCHVCGRFTSSDHITKIDEEAGWMIDTSLDTNGFVTCSPECRNDHAKKPAVKTTKSSGKRAAKPRKATAKRGAK